MQWSGSIAFQFQTHSLWEDFWGKKCLELDTGIDINIYISMDTGRNVGLNK